MEVWHGPGEVSFQGAMVTLGFFDGVHAGHKALISGLQGMAQGEGARSVALTMWPHPRIVLGKEPGNFRLLTDLDYKLQLLEETGLDAVLILDFTLELAALGAWEFLERLYEALRPKGILMGYDHRFGHGGEGDFPLLQRFGREKGIAVRQGDALRIGEREVSSTLVRRTICQGDMERAATLLGRDYGFPGVVVPGKQIGRTIGFPTANIEPSSGWQLLPSYGVYVGYATGCRPGGEEEVMHAIINVGTRPTVDDSGIPSVEAYFPEFKGDLYGQEMMVYFTHKLRDELRFSSLESLREQIGRDLEDYYAYRRRS
ncbi:MAG: riboflavin biosynthesis protein RibF [Bacteroidetes bacterium]|nr:MAG: riboflavin biosynthesis protein RibF [Bacteroidota bacterium]